MLARAALFIGCVYASTAAGDAPRLALVIDDVGESRDRGLRTIALPAPLTVAILPDATYTDELARRAYGAGKDVIVHLPMQPLRRDSRHPGGLTMQLDRTQFLARVNAADLERLAAEIVGWVDATAEVSSEEDVAIIATELDRMREGASALAIEAAELGEWLDEALAERFRMIPPYTGARVFVGPVFEFMTVGWEFGDFNEVRDLG